MSFNKKEKFLERFLKVIKTIKTKRVKAHQKRKNEK